MRHRLPAVAALLALILSASSMAAAATKELDPTEAAARGMAEGPALARAVGLDCTVSAARFVGENRRARTSYYEIACQQGLGYILAKKKKEPKPAVFTCLEANNTQADGSPSGLACTLPDNRDQKVGLRPFIAAANGVCAPSRARGIAQSSAYTYFEVLCEADAGFILITSMPPDLSRGAALKSCLAYPVSHPLACKLQNSSGR